MSFKREGDDKSQLNILKVTIYLFIFSFSGRDFSWRVSLLWLAL